MQVSNNAIRSRQGRNTGRNTVISPHGTIPRKHYALFDEEEEEADDDDDDDDDDDAGGGGGGDDDDDADDDDDDGDVENDDNEIILAFRRGFCAILGRATSLPSTVGWVFTVTRWFVKQVSPFQNWLWSQSIKPPKVGARRMYKPEVKNSGLKLPRIHEHHVTSKNFSESSGFLKKQLLWNHSSYSMYMYVLSMF